MVAELRKHSRLRWSSNTFAPNCLNDINACCIGVSCCISDDKSLAIACNLLQYCYCFCCCCCYNASMGGAASRVIMATAATQLHSSLPAGNKSNEVNAWIPPSPSLHSFHPQRVMCLLLGFFCKLPQNTTRPSSYK